MAPSEQDKTEEHRRKILTAVNQLSEQELERVSEMLLQPAERAEEEIPTQELQLMQEIQMAEDAYQNATPSMASGATHKTVISNLQKQLQDERDARARLEHELMSLKEMSLEIASQLKANEKKRYH